jgi:hypothetical protein
VSQEKPSINMAFGAWTGRWGWRVEWKEKGIPRWRDFYQPTDGTTGTEKEDAMKFKRALEQEQAA